MTVINIGLSGAKNLLNVEINKPFNEIKLSDLVKIVEGKGLKNIRIVGWVDVTSKK